MAAKKKGCRGTIIIQLGNRSRRKRQRLRTLQTSQHQSLLLNLHHDNGIVKSLISRVRYFTDHAIGKLRQSHGPGINRPPGGIFSTFRYCKVSGLIVVTPALDLISHRVRDASIQQPYSVIGNTPDFDSAFPGSSPGRATFLSTLSCSSAQFWPAFSSHATLGSSESNGTRFTLCHTRR